METRVRFETTSEAWHNSYRRFDGDYEDLYVPDPVLPEGRRISLDLVGFSATPERLFWTWKITEEVVDD